jgi:mono/diheme cytochrome c family protein
MKTLRALVVPAMVGGAALSGAAGSAVGAEPFDIGKLEYQASCATCHGPDGRGGGPLAEVFQVSMPDITQLSRKNGGVFPVARAYEIIDGRQQINAHGSREMPIWGKHFAYRAAPMHDDYRHNPEVHVRARILALIDYLYRLQVK